MSQLPLNPSLDNHHPAVTPMAFVQAILRAYERRGISPLHALDTAQIAPEETKNTDARITALQMEVFSGVAMRELDDEGLGWFSRALPWGTYGMLARASLSAPTLGLALARWCRHHGLIAGDIQLELNTEGERSVLSITELGDLKDMREFCLVSVLRNALGLASWFIDSRLPVISAQFPFTAPEHAEAYHVLFSGQIAFDAPQAAVELDSRYLALPLKRDELAMQQMLQRALPLMVRKYRRDRLLVARVRQILTSMPDVMHSARTLADELHVSTRTLHRQLKEEGASLQTLKDEMRRNKAIDLLNRTERPIKQVAQAAGFAGEKSFIRAFRAWTGYSPAEYRKHTRTASAHAA
ncbi:AraC family transcriptional regulator [Diaphorobacter sp.]|uniref:AraC family transcriptional regulator n=1 Tax=Diaphorobacter sp. TaxID=1934310 RepID=UPI0028AAA0CE|nr:AraC family transcriptional regulator [Diaphorobacter sp.]